MSIINRFSLLLISFILFTLTGIAQTDSSNNIRVKIVDLRNSDGKVGITLFNSADGFPSNSDAAIDKKYIAISNKTAETKFTDVPTGNYAIAIYHDEDEDGEIETNFIGIPKEGIGSSNNPKSRMGPPRYDDCEFDTKTTRELTIEMKYIL